MSASARPIKANELNVKDITFSDVRTNKAGGKTIYINNSDRGSLFVQTPELEIPFDSGNWNVDGSATKELYDMLCSLDEKVKEEAMKESLAWFKKKKLTMEGIGEKYTPMVKFSIDSETGEPDGKYPPTFRFKINQYDGSVQCVCWQHGSKEPMNVNEPEKEGFVKLGINCPYGSKVKHEGVFKKGTKVKMVLRCNGIWVTNGNFGCTWSAQQIRIKTAPTFNNYAFLDDTDDEDEVRTTEKLDTNFVESSDEEADEADEDNE